MLFLFAIYYTFSLKTVSSRLGHASVATTGNIYAHAIRTADETVAEKLEEIFWEKK